MSDILDIENLCVRYHDGVTAVNELSLRVEAGRRVALIGPNGAGKTSVLLAIMRGANFTGRIVIDGVELSRRTQEQARGLCGMTFQSADDQLFMPTLLDDAAFGPLNQGLEPADAQDHAQAAIAAVGLAGLEARSAHHLSGGQQRLASLATILSMNVKLLLLDEPGSNLDFRSRKRLIEILRSRSEAMLLATHDMDMVAELCERTIILDGGKIAADGPTKTILADAALLAAHGLA